MLLHSGSGGAWVKRHYAYFIMCPCITLPNMETLVIQRLFRTEMKDLYYLPYNRSAQHDRANC